MGTWGYKLYQDDITEDVRDEYIDLLHRGKTNEEVTALLTEEYADLDEEEISLFWFALADTQWKYGRLLPEVKETALKYLYSGLDIKRWESESPRDADKRARVLEDLEKQLLLPQPEPKKVKQYRLYRCQWNLGDVFAYRLDGECSKDTRFYMHYVYFVKIDETRWHPGHIIPIVYFSNLHTEELVDLSALIGREFTPQAFYPIAYQNDPTLKKLYRVSLITTSAKSIPKKLIFLGNIGSVDLIADENLNVRNDIYWKEFEQYTTKNMEQWM